MKLAPEQLANHLKQGNLLPVYLLTGDEPLLIQEAGDQLRQTARKAGFIDRDILHAESGFAWEELLNKANSLSLFSERQIIELHIPNGKPGPKGTDILNTYLASPSPDTLLIIFCPKLDGSAQKSKWFKSIDSAGATLTFWPIEFDRLPQWIQGRLNEQGISATPQVVQLLAERVEGNLLAAIQEIEKLKLLIEDDKLTEDDILSSVGNNARYDLFTLVDTALKGDRQRCLRILQGLQSEGTEATLMLWALSRDLRTLLTLSQSTRGGPVSEALLKKHRIWGKRKGLIISSLQRHSTGGIAQLLQQCGEVDRAIKGRIKQSPWLLMTDITLALASRS